MTSALKLTNVGKCFGAFWALRNVDLDFHPGEIHAVVGENGAGKSTLIKLIAGVYKLDEGTMSISGGDSISLTSPRDALKAGIGVVHQELDLFDNLSVAENIAIGVNDAAFWRAKTTVLEANAAKALSMLEVPHIAALSRVGDLSTSDKQLVAIAKVLTWDARVIILDEPTSALNAAEANRLLARVRSLRDRGVTVIYVSHKLGEIFSIADRVSVIRDGRLVTTSAAASLNHDKIVELMLGRLPNAIFPGRGSPLRMADTPALRVRDLTGHHLQKVELDVWSGEIVALAGLPDSGPTSLLQHIFGLRQAKQGEVSVAGTSVTSSAPPAAVRAGLAYLPADRLLDGILPLMSVLRNAGATSEAMRSHSNRERQKLALAEIKRLSVRSSSLENKITALSGGNQQKTLLARWLVMKPKVLMLDDPTRGVDIGAKAEIYKILREIADSGSAVLFTSSDSLELANLADRIVFFKEGQVVREVSEISHSDLDQYIAAA